MTRSGHSKRSAAHTIPAVKKHRAKKTAGKHAAPKGAAHKKLGKKASKAVHAKLAAH